MASVGYKFTPCMLTLLNVHEHYGSVVPAKWHKYN